MRQFLLQTLAMLALLLAPMLNAFGQGTTTSGMSGKVTDDSGEELIGALVLAVHEPTGAEYGSTTDVQGFFRLANMNVGGPYTLTVTYIGYAPFTQSGIVLTLGQTFRLNVEMSEDVQQLEGIEIVADPNDVFDGDRTGQQTIIDEQKINELPTIARNISDYARLNPLANIQGSDATTITIAGANNRFNAIYIDGAVNNDVFGLAASGTNGGQTGISPISVDAIEQYQVSVAPYDVRQSGFAGGSINAVTRSGTNDIEGSVYTFWRNENLAGKTPTDDPNQERTKLADFQARTTGFRIGGPIVKNKLFAFFNAEFQRDETPQPFDFETQYSPDGQLTRDTLDLIINKFRESYGYDPGGFENNTSTLNGDKYLIKLDYNISQDHKLTGRYSYVKAENNDVNNSRSNRIAFTNGSELFLSKTHSGALELKSSIGNNFSNKAIFGITIVRDDRGQRGGNFPFTAIQDGNAATIEIGGERFSSANALNQDVYTFTNDLEWYKGRHTFVFGTNFEFFKARNVFIRENFGYYQYTGELNNTLGYRQFLNDTDEDGNPIADRFTRSFSQVDNVVGDETAAAATFRHIIWGLYAQDEYQATDNLKLTLGLRIDLPFWPDDTRENSFFNNETIPLIEAEGYDLKGARTGQFIKTKVHWAPRFGFNWDVSGDRVNQLRGGVGIFTSRTPLVWAGGAYNNTGLTIGQVALNSVPFNPNVNTQEPGPIDPSNPEPSGQVDLFEEEFKLPQVLKVNIAYDRKLPWGLVGTIEFLYSNYINNIQYQNLNLRPGVRELTGTPDRRTIFEGVNPAFGGDPVDPTYEGGIYLASNNRNGYTYDFVLGLEKQFDNGFSGNLNYSFGDSFGFLDATSSQNNSQWRGIFNQDLATANRLGRNVNSGDQRSTFAKLHRVVAQVSYRKEYAGFLASQLSLFYNGQSARSFTYVLGARNFQILDDGGFDNNELWYVPRTQEDIVLVDGTFDGETVTAAEQWQALNAFIANDNYLSDRRGQFTERAGRATPFENIVDLRFLQDVYIEMKNGKRNILQFSIDIFNFGNMLNKDWGRRFQVGSFNTGAPVQFAGFQEDGTTPTYRVNADVLAGRDLWERDIIDTGIRSSRWQMQLGLRYIYK